MARERARVCACEHWWSRSRERENLRCQHGALRGAWSRELWGRGLSRNRGRMLKHLSHPGTPPSLSFHLFLVADQFPWRKEVVCPQGSGTMSPCCPLSGVAPGHWAWSWVSACWLLSCWPQGRPSAQQAPTCCVLLVPSPGASSLVVSELQRNPRRLLMVNCPRATCQSRYLPQPKSP